MNASTYSGINRRSELKEVTHQEIYDRLAIVEKKVDKLDESTKDVISAFVSARGAFAVLEFIGKLAKPILWAVAVCSAISIFVTEYFKR